MRSRFPADSGSVGPPGLGGWPRWLAGRPRCGRVLELWWFRPVVDQFLDVVLPDRRMTDRGSRFVVATAVLSVRSRAGSVRVLHVLRLLLRYLPPLTVY